MSIDRQRVRQYLQQFDFGKLFREELGWDNVDPIEIPLEVNNRHCTLRAIAQKREFTVYRCTPDDEHGIPDRPTCNKIDRQITDYSREHIIIYTDTDQTEQYWQWVRREKGKPVAPRGERWRREQDDERLWQKLNALYISWEEEDKLALSDVKQKTRKAFDVEKVTKKFYNDFKKQHGDFLKFIQGIQEQFDREWYASLMLNRLMFIYFIQRKGFLNDDPDYLQNKLRWCQENRGEDEFQSFYRYFLLKLFHSGLGSSYRDAELEALLGKVPYLNGGLFEVHQIEDAYPNINIPDSAFEKIFEFFGQWDWHLDDRPHKSQTEINPDVLGYIFEKYINQKQMGAYYTKEDITEYISKNTIIPYLFDAAEKNCKSASKQAFAPGGAVWSVLQENPDRYLYDAVKHGVIDANHNEVPLPEYIAVGIDDVSQRGNWNTLAPDTHGLPTELWREHVARRQRCLEVRQKLQNGEIHTINDLITYNLDIRQFVQDVIASCDDPDLINAFYNAITSISVLDPTCGSGAFLFAALNILQPLYEACLDRMQGFVEDLDRSATQPNAKKLSHFRDTLAQVADHPNQNYFILKQIILNNLYGVDIMQEATEICKLRLFLKLVAQVEVDLSAENLGLEPLPDIDFNIRAGNTLVGFATLEDVQKSITGERVKHKKSAATSADIQGKLLLGDDLDRINEAADKVSSAYQQFREMQTQHNMDANQFTGAKKEARDRLKMLNQELNIYLAKEYGINPDQSNAYDQWLNSHKPFHWFVEFYSIINNGGFDVIVGNPPYVEYQKVISEYSVQRYESEKSNNLYAFCMERSTKILNRKSFFGMIVPTSVVGLGEAQALRLVLLRSFSINICSTYSIRPAKLFEGVDQRLCIYLGQSNKNSTCKILSSKYNHWSSKERGKLFQTIRYGNSSINKILNRISQTGSEYSCRVLEALNLHSLQPISTFYSQVKSKYWINYHRSPRYWIRAIDFEPYFSSPTRSKSIHHVRDLYFTDRNHSKFIGALLNSSLFFFWFIALGNGRNITGDDVHNMPVGIVQDKIFAKISILFDRLMEDYRDNSLIRTRKDCEFQEFQQNLSKPIIDEIDCVLAQHYGIEDEELDFIINYDIKYRMGLDSFKPSTDTTA